MAKTHESHIAARSRTERAAAAAAVAFLSRDEICRRWGISRATSYRYSREGFLPKPVRLGPGAARWPLAEIEALERRAAEDRAS
jgi:predicted DNA-binding transcriptional regulator AlpA